MYIQSAFLYFLFRIFGVGMLLSAYTGEVLLVVDGGITDTPALTQVVETLRLSQLQLLCNKKQ